jgi:hypothetical protein
MEGQPVRAEDCFSRLAQKITSLSAMERLQQEAAGFRVGGNHHAQ